MEVEVRFSRKEHGNHRVVREGRGVRVYWPSGPKKYSNARRAIVALYNRDPGATPKRGMDPHLSWDRYFRQGRYQARPDPLIGVFDLFEVGKPSTITVQTPRPLRGSTSLAVQGTGPKLGIDLEGRYIEVRKLFFAGFASRVHRMGYDPEDVFQDLCRGLLVRNRGKCPWDERKSSFGHYIHMVAGCILSNFHRHRSRIDLSEVYGSRGADGEELDFAQANILSEPSRQEEIVHWRMMGQGLIPDIQAQAIASGFSPDTVGTVVTLLAEGWNYKEIAAQVSLSAPVVSRIAKFVRRVASSWR